MVSGLGSWIFGLRSPGPEAAPGRLVDWSVGRSVGRWPCRDNDADGNRTALLPHKFLLQNGSHIIIIINGRPAKVDTASVPAILMMTILHHHEDHRQDLSEKAENSIDF